MRQILLSALFMLLAGLPVAAKPDLVSLGPYGGDVRSLAVHPERPERIYLGTADGQLFVSDDFGEGWRKLSPGIGRRELVLDSLVFDPDDPETLYVGGWELKSDRGGLYRSTDGGESWEQFDLGLFQSSIRAVAVAPSDPDVLAVGITEGVLLSRDGGQSWDRISRGYRSLYNVHSLAFDPSDSKRLYVGTFRLAWKTANLGEDWTAIHNGMFWDSDLFSLQVDSSDPSVVFAGACSGIYRSFNSGDKWERLRNGLPSEAKRTRAVLIDPHDSNNVYAGTTEGLYRSRNRGESWQLVVPDVVVNAILVDPGNRQNLLLATDDLGILKSLDGGESFRTANLGFSQRQVAAVSQTSGSQTRYYASITLDGEHGGFFFSDDHGESWSVYNKGLGDAVSVIRAIVPAETSPWVYLGTARGIYRGKPGTTPWKRISGQTGLVVSSMGISPDDSHLYIGSPDGFFLLDLASGSLEWVSISDVYDGGVTALLVDRARDIVYIGTEMGVFRSSDQGKSWDIRVDGLPYTTVYSLGLSQGRLLCGTRMGIFFSDNQGRMWKESEGVFPLEIVAIERGERPGEVYAADLLVGYLFVSEDNGASWEAHHVGPALSRISSLSLTESGTLLAGTVSEGVYRIVPVGHPSEAAQSGAD